MTASKRPIPARHKGFNRAEIVDQNFTEFVGHWQGEVHAPPADDAPVLPGSELAAGAFRELFESQLVSRHLDLMARVLRVKNKVFYTIGSSGHEGNAMVARLTRHTDPAFLHYRSGAFMAERSRKLPGIDPVTRFGAVVRRQQGRPGLGRASQGVGQQAAVGAAADLDHRLAPAQGLRHRHGHRAGRAPGP